MYYLPMLWLSAHSLDSLVLSNQNKPHVHALAVWWFRPCQAVYTCDINLKHFMGNKNSWFQKSLFGKLHEY